MFKFIQLISISVLAGLTALPALAGDGGENNDLTRESVGAWNAERGALPGFVFAGTGIRDPDAAFFCLVSSEAAWALIDGRLYAMNHKAMVGSVIIALGQEPTRVLPWTDPSNPAASDDDVKTRIMAQVERRCDPQPVRERSAPDTLGTALHICAIVDASGISASPCDLSAWSRTVTITADVSGRQARAICKDIQVTAKKLGMPAGWKAEIVSPFSNGKSLAFCDL